MARLMVQGRPWNSFDAYLFDIDGTLLHCRDAVHYFAFCDVLNTVTGRKGTLDGVQTHGNVDVGILRDALAIAGIPEEQWRPRLPAMREQLCSHVRAHRAEFETDVLPGVRTVLEHLRSQGAVLGTATGNLGQIGQAKLEHAGLWDFFTVGGWSDEHESRRAVFHAAVQKMRLVAGMHASICVLGDTPVDVSAAQAVALPVIAVATGIYSCGELAATAPDLLVASMEELL